MLTVAEAGSFRKASGMSELGQPALTRRIQKLEDALGVSLFERRRSGARLTRAGWSFSQRARSILGDLEDAVDAAYSAGAGQGGQLHLGHIASLSRGALRTIITVFAAEHPEVDISFVESERGDLLTLLSHRRLDVVMASGDFPVDYGDSALLTKERIYVALSADDRLASESHLSWADVRDARFLVSATEPGPEIHEYIIRRLADLGQPPHVTRHRVGREGIMNLVGLGFGVSLVAEHWLGVAYPNVVFRPVGPEDERVPFSLLWLPHNDNPALRRFLSLALSHAKRGSSPAAPLQSPHPSP